MDFDKYQSVDLNKYKCPVPGIKVLVVDCNLTFLTTVSTMLQSLECKVVTASLASEALSIIEEKKNELNLVLVEIQLPDMGINVLTEKIREISDLPYFLMTADDNLFNTLRALYNGSKLYFKKPIMPSDLSGLWKFVMWKIEDGKIASEHVRRFGRLQSGEITVNNSRECQPFMNAGEKILRSAKRKEQERLKIGVQSESLVLKRKRLSSTVDSSTKFLGSVKSAGINAPPNPKHQPRNVPGLTKENVTNTNYFKRFHQSWKRANPIQQHSNIHTSHLNLGSQNLSQTDNDNRNNPRLGLGSQNLSQTNGNSPRLGLGSQNLSQTNRNSPRLGLGSQSVSQTNRNRPQLGLGSQNLSQTDNDNGNRPQLCLESQNLSQTNVNMPQLCLGSHNLSQTETDNDNLNRPRLGLGSQNLSKTDNDIGSRPRMGNHEIYLCNCMYLHSLQNTLSSFSISSSSGQTLTIGQNQFCLPWDLLAVAHCTSGSGEVVNNANGVERADISQVENGTDGKVFFEDTCAYCVDDPSIQSEMDFSTLLADDVCQKFPPQLPVPLLPSDEKKHAIFGDEEAGQTDEIFYPPNGTQQFSDEDLKIWLSRVNPRIT